VPRPTKYSKRRAQSLETPADRRTYFRDEHAAGAHVVTFARPYRDDVGRTRVMYSVDGQPARESPRPLVAWLDDQDILFVQREVQLWRDRVNEMAGAMDALYPDFFQRHQADYIVFAGRTAGAGTVDRYFGLLGRYVFPFFVGTMHESNAAKWAGMYPAFRTFLLRDLEPASANIVLGVLRSYLRFLEYRGEYRNLMKPENERIRKRDEGKVLPCDILPEFADAAGYLRALEPGYFRWLLTLCAAFGVRISEAVATTSGDLVGADELAAVTKSNDRLAKVNEKFRPIAMLQVSAAKKQKMEHEAVERLLGTPNDEPKTGPYVAACISRELGELLVEMLDAGENEPGDLAGLAKTTWYSYLEALAVDHSQAGFHRWLFHDYRRLHITLLALDWSDFWDVAHVHGQRSPSTAMRYYQWGLVRRRRTKAAKFRLNLPPPPATSGK
jgi:integrase